jgi:alkylation response protein AidB-like acyl-CoA dehydrogenase
MKTPADIAASWAEQRGERQTRRHLDPADFAALADAGFLDAAVPEANGGTWESVEASTRGIAEALRVLATGDPSVALVSSMHPAVLSYWLATDDPSQSKWREQRHAVVETAHSGSQWGTITSEPGSGGDVMRTRTRAERTDERHDIPGVVYRLSGDKHFGSGYGISDFMFTTALPDGEDAPAAFFLDMRPVKAGEATGITVIAEWDGAGMAATQSHAARLEQMPAVRLAWDGPIETLVMNAGPLVSALFTAVILGVYDSAITLAKSQLGPKRESLRAFEQVEWSRAEMDHWVATQAFEGALRAVEAGDRYQALRAGMRAKTAIADMAEQSLRRIGQVVGGGTFSRRSPYASWFEDVRALGYLRPPWGLAFDTLFATSFD